MLGDGDEEIEVYCIHDCDKAGTMIYQTLVQETKSRGARKIKVIDLGINPKEALEMGLQIENVEVNTNNSADYLDTEDKNWLQTHRIELNAMTSPQFVAWLEKKFNQYAGGKVIPDEDVLQNELTVRLKLLAQRKIQEEILLANNYEIRVEQYMQSFIGEISEMAITPVVVNHFDTQPADLWRAPISALADQIISLH